MKWLTDLHNAKNFSKLGNEQTNQHQNISTVISIIEPGGVSLWQCDLSGTAASSSHLWHKKEKVTLSSREFKDGELQLQISLLANKGRGDQRFFCRIKQHIFTLLLLTHSFTHLMVIGLFAAICSATMLTWAIISASVSKHFSTRPSDSASGPAEEQIWSF